MTIGHDELEDPTLRMNWLPAPVGAFRPILRMYGPEPAVLNGNHVIPAIIRTA